MACPTSAVEVVIIIIPKDNGNSYYPINAPQFVLARPCFYLRLPSAQVSETSLRVVRSFNKLFLPANRFQRYTPLKTSWLLSLAIQKLPRNVVEMTQSHMKGIMATNAQVIPSLASC